MCERTFEKELYSEWVIRNSLYWMTPLTRWKLLEELSSWTISFENDSPECLYEFERLLNDYALREKLLKWFTEFGHLNRGDMLTSEQHRCHNEKKKFQRRV